MDVEKPIYDATSVIKDGDTGWDKIQGYLHGDIPQELKSTITISRDY